MPEPTERDLEILEDLVRRLTYKPGWVLWVGRRYPYGFAPAEQPPAVGLLLTRFTTPLLVIMIRALDPGHREKAEHYGGHVHEIDEANHSERWWRRWLMKRILDSEGHEARELFTIDGERPYRPSHSGPNAGYDEAPEDADADG